MLAALRVASGKQSKSLEKESRGGTFSLHEQ